MSQVPNNMIRMRDGFSTTIVLSNCPTAHMYELEVTPPGQQTAKTIETTTMRNIAWRTFAAPKLKQMTAISATVSYASYLMVELQAQIGLNQVITITFPDNSTFEFWGYLADFTPGKNVEGAQPTATITVQPTQLDNNGVEQSPLYSPSSLGEAIPFTMLP